MKPIQSWLFLLILAGAPDGLSIGAAKPQEVLHAAPTSRACGTPIAQLSGLPSQTKSPVATRTQVAATPRISFPDLDEARTAFTDDPAYFDQLQPIEMAAKTGSPLTAGDLAGQRAECRARYRAGVRQFSDAEKNALVQLVGRIHPALRDDYPRMAALPWSFLKVSDQIEGGLPHTRGTHIVLSQSACDRSLNRSFLGPGSTGAIDLLVHEQTHVLQRAQPELFDSLYVKQWGFRRATSIDANPWLVEHHLANPDALDCRWVFPIEDSQGRRFIWPLVVFGDGPGPKRMPDDFSMVAVHVRPSGNAFRVEQQTDGRPATDELLDVRPYRAVFPMTTNVYHPHEAAAAMLAMLVVVDRFVPRSAIDPSRREAMERSLAPLRAWFRANLK